MVDSKENCLWSVIYGVWSRVVFVGGLFYWVGCDRMG